MNDKTNKVDPHAQKIAFASGEWGELSSDEIPVAEDPPPLVPSSEVGVDLELYICDNLNGEEVKEDLELFEIVAHSDLANLRNTYEQCQQIRQRLNGIMSAIKSRVIEEMDKSSTLIEGKTKVKCRRWSAHRWNDQALADLYYHPDEEFRSIARKYLNIPVMRVDQRRASALLDTRLRGGESVEAKVLSAIQAAYEGEEVRHDALKFSEVEG